MVEIKAVTAAERLVDWIANNEAVIAAGALALVGAFAILIIGVTIARIASSTLRRILHGKNVDKTIIQFTVNLLRYVLIAFAVIAAVGRLGVQTTSIIAVIGAAGLAIGLALQSSLSNFAAGILLVVLRPFRVGEFVDLGGILGTVDEVNIFATTLCMPDNKVVVVPNGKIIGGNIINYTRHPHRRVDISVSVAYDAQVDQVKAALLEAVDSEDRILGNFGNTVRLLELDPPSANYVVRVWVSGQDYWDVYFDLIESIKNSLDRHQVPIPCQQVEVRRRRNPANKI